MITNGLQQKHLLFTGGALALPSEVVVDLVSRQ